MKYNNIIQEAYTKHAKVMAKKVNRRVGGPQNAEDVVQETFARALEYQRGYDPSRPILGWLTTILNNVVRDFKKAERRQGAVNYNEDVAPSSEEVLIQDNMIEQVHKEIEARPEGEAYILRMVFLQNFNRNEIASFTEYTANNINVMVTRFRKMMRDKYGTDLYC